MRKTVDRIPHGPLPAGLLLTLGTVLTFAPDHYLPMLARAFLLEWVLLFVFLSCIALALRWWWLFGAAITSMLLLVPPMVPARSADTSAAARDLRIAHLNVLQPNRAYAAVVEASLATDADLLSFQEVAPAWASALTQGLQGTYPHHVIVPGNDCYGIALFSKRPLLRARVLHLTGHPVIDATVHVGAQDVRVLAMHASSPGSYAEYRDRNLQLDRLAAVVQASQEPVVVVGDLNTVGWDEAFRRLCQRTGLRENAGTPVATWPSLAGLALIPLDHVLATPAVAIGTPCSFRIPGSDHRGLVADLDLRP